MIQVIKKKQETNLSLLKRFSRKIKQSRHILHFKNTQFKKRPKSALRKKNDAMSRVKRREKMTKLYKLGKIEYPPK